MWRPGSRDQNWHYDCTEKETNTKRSIHQPFIRANKHKPFSGKTCKSQVYFVEIFELLSLLVKTDVEMRIQFPQAGRLYRLYLFFCTTFTTKAVCEFDTILPTCCMHFQQPGGSIVIISGLNWAERHLESLLKISGKIFFCYIMTLFLKIWHLFLIKIERQKLLFVCLFVDIDGESS